MVYFGRHDEVAFGQTVDFVGPNRNLDLTPGEQDIGVMALLFGKRTDPVYKIQGLPEVREGERAGDVVLVDDLPVGPIGKLLVDLS